MRSYNDRMGVEFMTSHEVERSRIAMAAVALDCERGKHRTETDADTGDEVCRFCGTVDPAYRIDPDPLRPTDDTVALEDDVNDDEPWEPAAEQPEPVDLGACINCGDDLWEGEQVVAATDGGGYRCMICEVRRQRPAERPEPAPLPEHPAIDEGQFQREILGMWPPDVEQPEPARGVGWRLARDEDLLTAVEPPFDPTYHLLDRQLAEEDDASSAEDPGAERPEGSDR